MMISNETARDIALAYREVEVAEKLLAEVREAIDRYASKDIRDSFGRRVQGLELGVPSGEGGRRCFNVAYNLAIPIIETHIANQRALISALSSKAALEIGGALG